MEMASLIAKMNVHRTQIRFKWDFVDVAKLTLTVTRMVPQTAWTDAPLTLPSDHQVFAGVAFQTWTVILMEFQIAMTGVLAFPTHPDLEVWLVRSVALLQTLMEMEFWILQMNVHWTKTKPASGHVAVENLTQMMTRMVCQTVLICVQTIRTRFFRGPVVVAKQTSIEMEMALLIVMIIASRWILFFKK